MTELLLVFLNFFMSIFLCKVKTEQKCPATKKRKTKWQNGLKNMPGDTRFAKDGKPETVPMIG